MAVKAPVHPFRFDVIPGVAVVAPEEDVVSLVVFCVRFVKAIMMGPWLTLSSVFRVTGIRGCSASVFLSIPLLSCSSLSISAGDIGLS